MSSIYDWSLTASANDTADTTVDWREGQMPDTVNNSARAMMARVAEWLADQGGALTTGGVVNAYTLTANSPFTALEDGLIVAFKASVTNTAAATINVNATGSKAIRRIGDTADVDIEANVLVSGQVYVARYSTSANAGTGAWMLVNAPVRALSLKSTGIIGDDPGNRSKLDVFADVGANAAFMSFTRSGSMQAYFGLDTDNKFKVGGSGMGDFAYEVYHSNNREIPLNTRTVFYQAAAPTGWTQVTGLDNRALRVVDGEGGGSGGSLGFTTVFSRTATDGTAITTSQMPSHSHGGNTGTNSAGHTHDTPLGGVLGINLGSGGSFNVLLSAPFNFTLNYPSGGISANHTHAISAEGGGAAHTHGMDMRVAYIDLIVCQRSV